MAIKMNVGISKFFQHVLYSHVYGKFNALLASGHTFNVSLFSVEAKVGTNYSNLNLPSSTSNLMKVKTKDITSYSPEGIAITKINNWVDALHVDLLAGMAPVVTVGFGIDTAVGPAMGTPDTSEIVVDYSAADAVAMAIAKTKGITKKSKPKSAPPVGEPVHLKEATLLGQKVRGTSGGSVYTVIALSPRVKVASKVSGAQLSLRVEWTADVKPAELDAIKQSGANWNGNYSSLHVDAGSESMIRRTVGAFLFGSGITFEEYVDPSEVV